MAGSPLKANIEPSESNVEPSLELKDGENGKRTIFIGIAGGTASGKTTVCEEIYERVQVGSNKECVMIPLDCFYKECTPEQMENIGKVNFDHPSMFDWPLLKQIFHKLQRG